MLFFGRGRGFLRFLFLRFVFPAKQSKPRDMYADKTGKE